MINKAGRRYITMHVANNSIYIVMAKSYWKALKKAQKYFNSDTKVRVWQDTFSTN